MNITLSLNEKLIERARLTPRKRGESLNSLIRKFLESVAGEAPGEETARELLRLMREHGGHSGGRRIRRDEAYEDRT